jgi:hypothetical protein
MELWVEGFAGDEENQRRNLKFLQGVPPNGSIEHRAKSIERKKPIPVWNGLFVKHSMHPIA